MNNLLFLSGWFINSKVHYEECCCSGVTWRCYLELVYYFKTFLKSFGTFTSQLMIREVSVAGKMWQYLAICVCGSFRDYHQFNNSRDWFNFKCAMSAVIVEYSILHCGVSIVRTKKIFGPKFFLSQKYFSVRTIVMVLGQTNWVATVVFLPEKQ